MFLNYQKYYVISLTVDKIISQDDLRQVSLSIEVVASCS